MKAKDYIEKESGTLVHEKEDPVMHDMIRWMEEYSKSELTEYTEFLLKEGFCDSDVYSEGNSAIDKYLYANLR